LLGPWVDELSRVCAALAEQPAAISLDLSAVTFLDGAGVKLLHELQARGMKLTACSGLVAELLHLEHQ
jgi:anti-anti-sigma regulatory factor